MNLNKSYGMKENFQRVKKHRLFMPLTLTCVITYELITKVYTAYWCYSNRDKLIPPLNPHDSRSIERVEQDYIRNHLARHNSLDRVDFKL
jgi:hypothetical protein